MNTFEIIRNVNYGFESEETIWDEIQAESFEDAVKYIKETYSPKITKHVQNEYFEFEINRSRYEGDTFELRTQRNYSSAG